MSLLNNGPHDEQHQTNATTKNDDRKKKYYDKLSAPFPKPLPNFLFRVKQFDLRTSWLSEPSSDLTETRRQKEFTRKKSDLFKRVPRLARCRTTSTARWFRLVALCDPWT